MQTVNRQQLFRNYRILNYFLADDTAAVPAAPEALDLENPLLAAIENLTAGARALQGKKIHGVRALSWPWCRTASRLSRPGATSCSLKTCTSPKNTPNSSPIPTPMRPAAWRSASCA